MLPKILLISNHRFKRKKKTYKKKLSYLCNDLVVICNFVICTASALRWPFRITPFLSTQSRQSCISSIFNMGGRRGCPILHYTEPHHGQ